MATDVFRLSGANFLFRVSSHQQGHRCGTEVSDRKGNEVKGQSVRLTDEQRIDWLRLIRSRNIGPRGIGVAFVAWGEPDYPARLQMIDDALPLLTIRGNAAALARPMVAMVGSRNASGAGLKFTQMIARELEAGFVVVSGLARGIDAAAHKASLATGTIAVLAGGQDRIYPAEHASLLEAILPAGAALSEMPLGWEPRASDFPRRNRLISGLSLGVVIVEAAKRSGSLITARCALDQGREVFAVPGSPLDPRAEGTNGLIKQGATPVTETADIVSVLQPIMEQHELFAHEPEREITPDDGEPADDERTRIVSLLRPAPVQIDDLVRRAAPACH